MPILDLIAACLLSTTGEPIEMFDGTTLDNWSGNPINWHVEDGTIIGATRADSPLQHNEYLYWDGIASDFILELDIRVLGGNSGIQYRSQPRGPHDVEGYQADLDSDNQYTGALYETNGRGLMSRRGQRRSYLFQDNRRDLGNIPGVDEPAIDPHEWNRYRITADGPLLTHHINGRLMSEVIDEDPERRRDKGRIAFQLHTGAPMRIEIRDISIQPLNNSSIHMEPLRQATSMKEPEWIWCTPNPNSNETCVLTRSFVVPSRALEARLLLTCDNSFTAELDGHPIARGTEWWKPVRIDIPDGLSKGKHVLRIKGHNDHGPAGTIARLTWSDEEGTTHRLVTDSEWTVESGSQPATSFGKASSPKGPWPDAFSNTESKPQLKQGEIQVPSGFEVDTLHEAMPGEGSWVAMTFDDQGRLIVSPQSGGLLRLTLPDEPAGEIGVETIDLDIGGAQGLLVAHDSLYAMVTRNGDSGGGLWRLRDTTGNDQYDSLEQLAAWGAGNEHGNHALILGPDDMIYMVQGNHSPLPPRVDSEGTHASPYRNWAEDDLLKRMWDANGHAVGVMAPGGVIMRTDADASRFEIIAGGLRNSYDIAFNETGDLFTWDSDMEWDLGTPWYRPPRALHVVPGGEFGWRGGTAKWPDWYPDSLPTMLNMPQGSPTGMVFGGDGNFPEPWQSSLLLADWTYGRIFALHLEEDGATWRAQQEIFAAGRPFNVSDLVFGPDGHLYLITGGRGTQSALYRIRATDVTDGVAPERSAGATELRAQRRSMEALQRTPSPAQLNEIREALHSNDRVVRYAARIALERIAVDDWREAALNEQHPKAALEMLLAFSRQGTTHNTNATNSIMVNQIIERALEIGRHSDDREIQRNAMRVIALALARQPTPSASTLEAINAWELLRTSEDPQARRLATELLVRLQTPALPARLIPMMETAPTQEDALHAALLLRLVENDWTDDLRRRYIQWLRSHQNLAGGRSINGFVKAIELETLEQWDKASVERVLAMLEQDKNGNTRRTARPRINAWTVTAMEPHLAQVTSNRNFVRGRQAYRETRCMDCHRFHGMGGSTGPDLTGIGARFSDRDLLEAILEPSKVIADQYQATMVIRTDDTIDTGRLLEDSDSQVILNVDPYGYEPLAIPRAEIAEMLPSPVSTMPVGHVDALTRDELLDLLAYLRSAGDPSAIEFQSHEDGSD
ncbi:MAG: DUF1080 domain-containing protein [Phycisphaerales bacterium]|nr:DUF1080 domain-containing protein [Phycisphaerales bacterium]